MNKRKSPQTYRSKSPPTEILPSHRNAHTGFVYPHSSKNDLFSSNEESTQEQKAINPTNLDYTCFLGESLSYNNVQKAFMKTKKEKQKDDADNKYSRGLTGVHQHQTLSNSRNTFTKSDKNLNHQKNMFSDLPQKHKKNTNERYHDYFDSKIYALRGVKSKPKMPFYEKLSDSGDSAGSYNSGYSVQSEGGQIKGIISKRYENLNNKKHLEGEKGREDAMLFSKHSPIGQNRNKFSNNVFRPQYMSPPVLSKDSTYELDSSHDIIKKSYSPNNEDRNKLPTIIDNILKRKSQKSPNQKQFHQIELSHFHEIDINKKRCSITPNKLQIIHHNTTEDPDERPISVNQISAPNISEKALGLTPQKKGNKSITPYTPQHKGHGYHKSDGPIIPPNYHSDKKGKNWEDDNFDNSFLIQGSTHICNTSRKNETEESHLQNQSYLHTRKRTSHISSVLSLQGKSSHSRVSSFHSILNINQVSSQNSKFKTITLFPFTKTNTLQSFDFKIIKKLAENRNSSTFQCIQANSNIIFCLKKTKITSYNLKDIALEHKIGTKFNHPNIVKTFCSLYDRNSIYLLMEYMEGGTLLERKVRKIQENQDLISRNKVYRAASRDEIYGQQHTQRIRSEQKLVKKHRIVSTLKACVLQQHKDKSKIIKDILQQILEGVAYLHRRNIWHRDLKPDNIFISHGTYKIGDFGSCSHNDNQDHVGTLDYAAPEIMLKIPFNQSIDIWSLGCIAYELEAGFTPFFDPNRSETVKRIVNVQYDKQLIKNEQLSDLIGKMLVRNGSRRISAEDALNHGYFKQTHVQSRMRI